MIQNDIEFSMFKCENLNEYSLEKNINNEKKIKGSSRRLIRVNTTKSVVPVQTDLIKEHNLELQILNDSDNCKSQIRKVRSSPP